MKYIFFTDLRSSKVVPKEMQSQHKRSYKKSFLREHSVSLAQKSILRECRTYTAEIEGEEVQKTFLRGCRTYITEIEGEEAQKSFLRGCRACVFQCGCVSSASSSFCIISSHHFTLHYIIHHIALPAQESNTKPIFGECFVKIENVLRHEVSFGRYRFIGLE
jgi:hypothetical protein